MKNTYKSRIMLLAIVIIFYSCSLNKEYQSAITSNTVDSYINFLSKHPNSKYTFDIRNRINIRREEDYWQIAQNLNTENSYNEYLSKYPFGVYASSATIRSSNLKKQRIENEKRIKEDKVWEQAIQSDAIYNFENYKMLYPNGRYVKQANDNLTRLKLREISSKAKDNVTIDVPVIDSKEQKEWERAEKLKTIAGYKNYLKIYPNGTYSDEAEKKIIDKEVDIILAGSHGNLPAPQKTSFENSYMSTTEINIENNTKYNLTVFYSGPTSKRILLTPNASNTIVLDPGKYKVAAKVNASNIRPFAGRHDLNSGKYSETFYIVTSFSKN